MKLELGDNAEGNLIQQMTAHIMTAHLT